jgi:hypothetical protein
MEDFKIEPDASRGKMLRIIDVLSKLKGGIQIIANTDTKIRTIKVRLPGGTKKEFEDMTGIPLTRIPKTKFQVQ